MRTCVLQKSQEVPKSTEVRLVPLDVMALKNRYFAIMEKRTSLLSSWACIPIKMSEKQSKILDDIDSTLFLCSDGINIIRLVYTPLRLSFRLAKSSSGSL